MSSNTINSTNPTIPVDKPKRTKKVNKNPEENKNGFIEVKEDKPKKVDKVVKPKKSKKMINWLQMMLKQINQLIILKQINQLIILKQIIQLIILKQIN